MTDVAVKIAYIILWRLRGDKSGLGKAVELLLAGAALYYIQTESIDWFMAAYAVLLFLGAIPAWSKVFGPVIHEDPLTEFYWWQIGWLRKSKLLAVTARGAFIGLPALLVCLWVPEVWKASLAIAVAFPLGAYLSLLTDDATFNLTGLAERLPFLKNRVLYLNDEKWQGWRIPLCYKRWQFAEWLCGLITVVAL